MALRWRLLQHHCYTPDNCHVHTFREWNGVASASFSAPDHEYPSYLELVLSATDSSVVVPPVAVGIGVVAEHARRGDVERVVLVHGLRAGHERRVQERRHARKGSGGDA